MLRGAWAFVVFVVASSVIASYAILKSLILGALGRAPEIDLAPAQAWARVMLAATGVRVDYEGLEHAQEHHPCVFAVNHASNLDIWVVTPKLHLQTKFVAKDSLFKMPFVGWAMKRCEFISIDRTRRHSAIQSLRRAGERIRAGRSVIVFPEGTRSKDGSLQPFKKGPFHLALSAGVPVVPVAISGSWDVLRPGDWRVHPGPVGVRFLPPIDTGQFQPDGHLRLLERTHAVIAEALQSPPNETTPAGRAASAASRGSTFPCDNAP